MKIKNLLPFAFLFVLLGCASSANDPAFIEKSTGRYLYNSDELIEVYFAEQELFLKWRGAEAIKPLRTDDGVFYVKEMNEKIHFITNEENDEYYIGIVPKEDDEALSYNYRKLSEQEKIPSEFLELEEYDKALESFISIKMADSLDPAISQDHFNSLGYQELRAEKYERALEIFKINVELYPESPNVYDSLGEGYMKSGDTAQAIVNYKKTLSMDSANSRAKRMLERLEKKE